MTEANRLLADRTSLSSRLSTAKIARRRRRDFFAAGGRLPNQLDNSRRLAGTRRAVNDCHVQCGEARTTASICDMLSPGSNAWIDFSSSKCG